MKNVKSIPLRKLYKWTIIIALLLVVLGCKIIAEAALRQRLTAYPSVTPSAATYRTESLQRLSMGFQNLLSAIMWVRLLQKTDVQAIKTGKVSWEYTQLDAITSLDSKFNQAYSFGAIVLSVFRQDKLGAKLLLEKWVRARPNYWQTHYMLGYHLYYELGDFKNGSKQILLAASLPSSPPYLSSLGIRLMSETGALAQAMRLSLEIFPIIKDPEAALRLSKRIRGLNYAIQKGAWEGALESYRKKEKTEPQSLKDLAPYVSLEYRNISSIVDNTPDKLRELLSERFRFRYSPSLHKIEGIEGLDALKLDGIGIFMPEKTSKEDASTENQTIKSQNVNKAKSKE